MYVYTLLVRLLLRFFFLVFLKLTLIYSINLSLKPCDRHSGRLTLHAVKKLLLRFHIPELMQVGFLQGNKQRFEGGAEEKLVCLSHWYALRLS